MRYGISVPNFGAFSEPALVAGLASRAEQAGWDGFFVWDHIVVADSISVADPWIELAAVARETRRIALGPMVTPIPRRRPWVLSRQATTLDRLSEGRLILGVGIGFPSEVEFGTFGESTDDRRRADMLDEGLEILDGMWSGERFAYSGRHYSVEPTRFSPRPVTGAIPIWIGATWGSIRPMRRAARHQGVFPVKMDMSAWTVEEVGELTRLMRSMRGSLEGFDIAVGGSIGTTVDVASDYEEAGATWLVVGPEEGQDVTDLEEAILAGPPSRQGR